MKRAFLNWTVAAALTLACAVSVATFAGGGGAGGFGGGGGGFGGGGGGFGGRGAPVQLGDPTPIPDVVKQANPTRTPNPAATFTRSSVRSDQRHNSFVETANKGDVDILFEGDSITDWWQQAGPLPGAATASAPAAATATAPATTADAAGRGGAGGFAGRGGRGGFGGQQGGASVFKKYFGDAKVANFAIAGDTTQGLLWGLKNGEGRNGTEPVKMQPKAIMLMIGTNNTGSNTGPEIAEGVGAVVQELRNDFPNAKIMLLAIFPRGTGPTDANRIKNEQANKIIAKLDDGQHIFFKNINDNFLKPDGSLIGFRGDNLHPTPEGYEIWAQQVADTLKGWAK